jgi:hypothetical protein
MKVGLFLFVLLLSTKAFAQPTQTQKFLPAVLQGSPEATSFAKYGNYEVNLFTGVPDISIPVYSIQVGELKVPISLSYHAGGIKVNDISSWAGLGWSLNAGGSISRKIMGGPDDMEGNYLSATSTSNNRVRSSIDPFNYSDLDYLRLVYQGGYDVEPDIFSYSFPGKSGKFLFSQTNNFQPFFIPYAPLKASYSYISTNNMLLNMKDEAGIEYKFEAPEWTSTSAGPSSVNAPSTWMMTKMISSNKQDTIIFNYTTGGVADNAYFSDYEVINDNSTGTYSSDLGTTYTSFGMATTQTQILSTILFKNGKIVFEQGIDTREDFFYARLPKRINAMKIYNYDALTATYKLLKTIQFYQTYFVSGTDGSSKRLRLDKVEIKDAGGTVVENYLFDYNNTVVLPGRNNSQRMIDYWGYYNNKNNSTLVPQMSVDYLSAGSGTTYLTIGSNLSNGRDPDPAYMQACMLQKITYPTGGYTTFDFETNQYIDAQSNIKYSGGLRIKQIKSFENASAAPIVKTYKYGTGESGYGRQNFDLANYSFRNEQTERYIETNQSGTCNAVTGTRRSRTFLCSPTIDIEPYDGSPVAYPVVTEYIGDATTNSGKTIYEFTDHADTRTTMTGYGKPMLDSYHFVRGHLKKKFVYKNTAGTYTIVAETNNTYGGFADQFTSYVALGVFKWQINNGSGGSDFPASTAAATCGYNGDSYSYRFNNYDVHTGDAKLIQNKEIVYDQNDPSRFLTTTTNYYYDNINHHQVTRIETINSRGETLLTTKQYPHEVSSLGVPYTTMVTNNIINKVVKETVTKTIPQNSPQQISYLLNAYNNWGNNNYLPQTVQLQVKSNPQETRAVFNGYDSRGNILDMQKSSDIKQSFIWDYQQMQPVAQVINASMYDIAYTSFESSSGGQWTGINTAKIVSNGSVTGKRSYYGSNFSFSRANLNSATSYIVSYWSQNGAYSIGGTKTGFPQTLRSISINSQTWTLYEHQVTGQSTITVTGSGSIDELRLYPANAQMTTISYEPLVGITSQCDASGRIVFYTYDSYGRLILVRDDNKNIIKQQCYNYKGQTENCNIFLSAVKTGSYQKNDCGANYTGSFVTYTVPAGIYHSTISAADADAQAQNDLSNNGPNYANQNGTCTYTPAQITIQGYNNYGTTYQLKLTNNSTSQVYYLTLNTYTYSAQTLGQVPAGTYMVQFIPQGSPVYATYDFNGYTSYGTGATFYNMSVNATSIASMH